MTSTDLTTTGAPAARPRLGGHWIADWRPEDPDFWRATGHAVARRNLLFSVLSEHIGFSIWSLWSVLVLFLGPEYGIDPAGKFLLTALPAFLGSLLRVPYTLAVAVVGGRNWTVISASLLLVPSVFVAAVLEPGVAYSTLLLAAATAGVGGGNFASSMTNINHFYPKHLKGWALGVNAGGGNLGVAVVQLVGLGVLATLGAGHPRILVAIYIPLIVATATLAALRMDNLVTARNAQGAMREVARHRETWIMSLLYIGTFGSFIGFSFAFGQVLLVQFPEQFTTPSQAASLTFLGPLVGSLIRPVGGLLADRYRGSIVTFWNFSALAVATGIVYAASRVQSLPMYLVGFILIFALTGIGNGSTYKMIPAIFHAKGQLEVGAGEALDVAEPRATRRAGALIGLAGAIGAFGGVLVNLAFRQSFLTVRNGDAAVIGFLVFYLVCLVVTWAVFLRRHPGRLDGV